MLSLCPSSLLLLHFWDSPISLNSFHFTWAFLSQLFQHPPTRPSNNKWTSTSRCYSRKKNPSPTAAPTCPTPPKTGSYKHHHLSGLTRTTPTSPPPPPTPARTTTGYTTVNIRNALSANIFWVICAKPPATPSATTLASALKSSGTFKL